MNYQMPLSMSWDFYNVNRNAAADIWLPFETWVPLTVRLELKKTEKFHSNLGFWETAHLTPTPFERVNEPFETRSEEVRFTRLTGSP